MEEKFWHAEEEGEGKNLPYRTKNALSSFSAADFDLSLLKGKSTFGANEKLKSQKITEQLFKEGKSVSQNGFTLVYLYLPLNSGYPAQAGFSVPKRFFKRAVHRNRIKRLMREAYRLNKYNLYQSLADKKQQVALMWIYKGKTLPQYEQVLKAITVCMQKLVGG